jgi:hypothetical protein
MQRSEVASVVDQLLSTGQRLEDLTAVLDAWLPAGIPVYSTNPDPSGPSPFVVLGATLTPQRHDLGGHWSTALLHLNAFSVHDTAAQARALADLVRTWVLTVMAIPGQIDVEPDQAAVPTDPGGVPQIYESWTATLTRV